MNRFELCPHCGHYCTGSTAYCNTPITEIEGTWPADDIRRAFVMGAKWWEYKTSSFTMWNSDAREAEAEAEKRYPGGKPR